MLHLTPLFSQPGSRNGKLQLQPAQITGIRSPLTQDTFAPFNELIERSEFSRLADQARVIWANEAQHELRDNLP